MTTLADELAAVFAIANHNHISLDSVIPPNVHSGNYVRPDRGRVLLITNLVLAGVTLLVVLARFYTRLFVAGSVGGDDITIGVAMLVVAGSTALNCYGVGYGGIGRHFYDTTFEETEHMLKFTYALPIVYSIGVVVIKMSILLFYRRLFGVCHPTLQRIVRYFLLFQLAFAAASVITFSCICNPVNAWWELELRVQGCPTFMQTMVLYVGLRTVTVLCDIIMLLLPIPMVWRLKLPLRQRMGLVGIFSLGLFACGVAIARLALLPALLMTLDASWYVLPIAILDQAEQCLGIITASIPALTALISKHTHMRAPPSPDSIMVYGQYTGGFDYLSYAYDPDRQNNMGCCAMAYSTSGQGGRGKSAETEDEQLVFGGGLGMISKTTTVTVDITKSLR
ncbi:hypothetical protein K440DRAFT_608226 [Wilcoxina mikolae CBS 423.85]|nr:hypothetical protein K440DRAFT_608226 [Wilcoxina mikolae CBS 423.85]